MVEIARLSTSDPDFRERLDRLLALGGPFPVFAPTNDGPC